MRLLYELRENCCGCGACCCVCPVGAIDLQPDEEGFLYPKVDESICVGCNQCIKVCDFKVKQKEKDLL